ncbi:MAG: AAA family ATPase [Chloroflexota bacterium]
MTISRQMGSLGSQTAFLLAEKLSYQLVWRELINQAARRAGAPEVALAAIDDLGLLKICPSEDACHAYHQAVAAIVGELAEQGRAVLLGRAGQVLLAGDPQALHVRIMAPVDVRVDRIAARLKITPAQALAQVQASDRSRRQYLKKFYNARWDDPALYDLVINTAHLTAEQAAGGIAAMLQTR